MTTKLAVAAGAALATLLGASSDALAWVSRNHYGVTYEACNATVIRNPRRWSADGRTFESLPIARWNKLVSWAGTGGYSHPFNANLCDWFARASRLADGYIFDNDAAHAQTTYWGGVNFMGGVNLQTRNFPDRDADPRNQANWYAHRDLPFNLRAPDVIVDTPWPDGQGTRTNNDPRMVQLVCPDLLPEGQAADGTPLCHNGAARVPLRQLIARADRLGSGGTIGKFVDYFFKTWADAIDDSRATDGAPNKSLTALFNTAPGVWFSNPPGSRGISYYTAHKEGCGLLCRENLGKEYLVESGGALDMNVPPATWIWKLGDILHQVQDSCTHQGITGAQHAYMAYSGVAANPDNERGGRLDVCTVNLTRLFFDSLAQFFADWGYEEQVIVYVSVRDAAQSRMTYGAIGDSTPGTQDNGFSSNTSMVTLMGGDTGQAIIDYWFQFCDIQCRDINGPANVLNPTCADTRMRNSSLYAFWRDLLDPDSPHNWVHQTDPQRIDEVKRAWSTGARAQYEFWYGEDDAPWNRQPRLNLTNGGVQRSARRVPNGTAYATGFEVIPAVLTPYQQCPRGTNRSVAYKRWWGFDSNEANWVCSQNGDPMWFPWSFMQGNGLNPTFEQRYQALVKWDYERSLWKQRHAMGFDLQCNQLGAETAPVTGP